MSQDKNYYQQRPSNIPPQGYPSGKYPAYPSPPYSQASAPPYPNQPPVTNFVAYPQQYSALPPQGYPAQWNSNEIPPYPPGTMPMQQPYPSYPVQANPPIFQQPAATPSAYPRQQYSQYGPQQYPQQNLPPGSWAPPTMPPPVMCPPQTSGSNPCKPTKYVHVGPAIPSLKPNLNSTPTADAKILYKAFKGIGCDNKAIINILTRRTSVQREKIKEEYYHLNGKNLIDRTVSEIYEPLERVLISLLHTGADLDAYLLRKAMKRLGTDEECLIHILVTRSSFQLAKIKESYQLLYKGKNLEKNIISETSGNFQKILIFLLNTPRDQTNACSLDEAANTISQIYSRSSLTINPSENLIPIFCKTSYDQFRLVIQEFHKLNGKTLHNYLKGYFWGEYGKTLMAIYSYIDHPLQYFAKHLKEGIEKNKINQVSRVVCTRCEIDLGSILQLYSKNFKTNATDELKKTFSAQCPDTVEALLILMGC